MNVAGNIQSLPPSMAKVHRQQSIMPSVFRYVLAPRLEWIHSRSLCL